MYDKIWRENNIKSWGDFIPKETNCEICNKKIYLNPHDTKKAIHFDHKKMHNILKVYPSQWLREHRRNSKNEKIWKSCNFGLLCNRCNRMLPVENRIEFVKKILNYITR